MFFDAVLRQGADITHVVLSIAVQECHERLRFGEIPGLESLPHMELSIIFARALSRLFLELEPGVHMPSEKSHMLEIPDFVHLWDHVSLSARPRQTPG